MNIELQRTLDRWVGVPLCAGFTLVDKLCALFRRKPGEPKKILVILLSEMGSLVLAQPMFNRIRDRYPKAEIHMLMFSKNKEVLELMGVVEKEHIIGLNDKKLSAFLVDTIKALLKLRSARFDVVIDCELFARTSSLFSWMTGAPVKVGFHPHTQEGLYRGGFITRPVNYNPYAHLSQQLLSLVESIESTDKPVAKFHLAPRPNFVTPVEFPQKELEVVARAMHEEFPTVREKRLVLVYPGGGILPIRAWPLEKYKALCSDLVANGFAVGLIGLREDKPLAREIVQHCQHENLIDLTGYTSSVRHLLALFHRADLLITNDGGPAQFSALTPIYSLVFFGPETPNLYGALTDRSFNFFEGFGCSPCLTAYNHRLSPCNGDNRCISSISLERVLSKAKELLEKSSSEHMRHLASL